eukprot:g2685.t1
MSAGNKIKPKEERISSLQAVTEEDGRGSSSRIERNDSVRFWKETQFQLAYYVNHPYTQIFILFNLFIVLFLADLWILASVPNEQDNVMNAILLLSTFIFIVEISICSWVIPGYLFGFFFWMDVLGTASVVIDLTWVSNFMFEETSQDYTLLRTAKTTRLGARAGKLTRLTRIVRVVKVMRFFTSYTQNTVAGGPAMSRTATPLRRNSLTLKNLSNNPEDAKPEKGHPLVIAEKLSAVISRQVAALIMIAILVFPTLTYEETDGSHIALLIAFDYLPNNNTIRDGAASEWFKFYETHAARPIYLNITNSEGISKFYNYSTVDNRPSPRNTDNEYVSGRYSTSYLSFQQRNVETALYNIGLIVCVIIMLIVFSLLLSQSVTKMVVQPMDRILRLIRKKASQLLSAFDDDNQIEQNDVIETDLLESIFDKMSTLLNLHNRTESDFINRGGMDANTKDYLMQNFTQGVEHKKPVKSAAQAFGGVASLKRQATVAMSSVDMGDLYRKGFEVLDFTKDELEPIAIKLYESQGLCEKFEIDRTKLWYFVREVRREYLRNLYHNFYHAVDVAHAIYRFMSMIDAQNHISFVEMLALQTAALCHDMGHPGVNNNYLIASRNQLAMTYNDKSPLENMHCAALYAVLSDENANILIMLDDDEWKECRATIIKAVLSTDMVQHFKMVKTVDVFTVQYERELHENSAALFMSSDEHRNLLIEILLHVADISNPLKQFDHCKKWSIRVMHEFFSQGDKEKAKNMPVGAINDRDTAVKPMVQVNFINFVVLPLMKGFVRMFPFNSDILDDLNANKERWQKMHEDGTWEEECGEYERLVIKEFKDVKKMGTKREEVRSRRRESLRRKTLGEVYADEGAVPFNEKHFDMEMSISNKDQKIHEKRSPGNPNRSAAPNPLIFSQIYEDDDQIKNTSEAATDKANNGSSRMRFTSGSSGSEPPTPTPLGDSASSSSRTSFRGRKKSLRETFTEIGAVASETAGNLGKRFLGKKSISGGKQIKRSESAWNINEDEL